MLNKNRKFRDSIIKPVQTPSLGPKCNSRLILSCLPYLEKEFCWLQHDPYPQGLSLRYWVDALTSKLTSQYNKKERFLCKNLTKYWNPYVSTLAAPIWLLYISTVISYQIYTIRNEAFNYELSDVLRIKFWHKSWSK